MKRGQVSGIRPAGFQIQEYARARGWPDAIATDHFRPLALATIRQNRVAQVCWCLWRANPARAISTSLLNLPCRQLTNRKAAVISVRAVMGSGLKKLRPY